MKVNNNNNKKLLYNIYKLIILFLFVCVFINLVDNNGKIGNGFMYEVSRYNLILFIVVLMFILYVDKFTGTLLFILFIIIYKFSLKETFKETFNIPNIKNIVSIEDEIKDKVKKQLIYSPNLKFSDNYYENIYNKYFNTSKIIDKFKTFEDNRVVDKYVKSDYELDYDKAFEARYKNSNLFARSDVIDWETIVNRTL